MKVDIYWICNINSGRLGIMPRPRGGDWLEDEILSLCNSDVNTVVSLLTDEEISELNLLEESSFCKTNNIEFISFPILDRNIPSSSQDTVEFIQNLINLLNEGKNIVIHCRQGAGRSALVAASIMAMCGNLVETVFERISVARGCTVPDTQEQRDWVTKFVREYFDKKK